MTSDTKRRLLWAAPAALVIALAPAGARAQSAPRASAPAAKPADELRPLLGRSSEVGALRVGGLVGPDFFSSTTGLRASLEGQFTAAEVAPYLYFDLAAQFAGVFASGATIIELVPKLRLRQVFLGQIHLYGDLGFGVAFQSLSAGTTSITNFLGDLRLAGGAELRLTPELSLVVEPVGLNIYLGSNAAFHYSLLAGALFRVL